MAIEERKVQFKVCNRCASTIRRDPDPPLWIRLLQFIAEHGERLPVVPATILDALRGWEVAETDRTVIDAVLADFAKVHVCKRCCDAIGRRSIGIASKPVRKEPA